MSHHSKAPDLSCVMTVASFVLVFLVCEAQNSLGIQTANNRPTLWE